MYFNTVATSVITHVLLYLSHQSSTSRCHKTKKELTTFLCEFVKKCGIVRLKNARNTTLMKSHVPILTTITTITHCVTLYRAVNTQYQYMSILTT